MAEKEREKQIAEFEKGYDLGRKLKKTECERLCQRWNRLEEKIKPFKFKPYEKMTKEEKELFHDHDLFWICEVDKMSQEPHSLGYTVASGFKKAVLEICAEKKTK